MKNTFYITKKELGSYFSSPIAYIVITVFLVIFGYFFVFYLNEFNFRSMQAMRFRGMLDQMNLNQMVIAPSYANTGVILLFIAPLITMRLFAEEKKSKTFELIMTSPVYLTEMIMGKFLAAFIVLALMFLLSAYSPAILFIVGTPEIGPVISTYIGILLMGGAFIAIGVFCSSITENQIVAAVVSFGMLLLFWIIGWMSQTAGTEIGKILSYISIIEHLENFLKGIIETGDIVYYLSFIGFWLFAAHRVIESQRWK